MSEKRSWRSQLHANTIVQKLNGSSLDWEEGKELVTSLSLETLKQM